MFHPPLMPVSSLIRVCAAYAFSLMLHVLLLSLVRTRVIVRSRYCCAGAGRDGGEALGRMQFHANVPQPPISP